MSVTIIRGMEVNRPTPEPLRSSVLDHATVVENTSFGWTNNEGLWPSYNCLFTNVPTPMCPDPLGQEFKSFSEVGWVPAFEFAVHAGVQCNPVGLDVEDQKRELARVFAANEGKGIEQALLANRFVATTSDDPVQWDPPVDLGTADSLGLAVAQLVGYAASVYAGQPTIHMPRAAAEMLGDRIVWKDGLAYTRSGAKVVIGGGYDGNTHNDPDWTLFVTGEVYIERSEQINVHQYVIPGDGSGVGSDENLLADNTSLVLAERMYRVAIDCFAAEITVTMWT